jgi:hypothetical protein
VHLLQEAEEEVQVSSEEDAKKDLVEEEEEEMDLEKDKDRDVIIVTNLVILRKILMQNCVIMNIKVLIQLLIFFLFASLSMTCGTSLWLRNRDSGASKPSKSPGDHTQPEPHQPLTWLDFLSPQVSNR